MRRGAGLPVLAVLLVSLFIASKALSAPPKTVRVLFVGNSLIYHNDLPATFATLYRATDPGVRVQTEMLAGAGGKLRERINEGQMAALLNGGRYDLVVIQELGGCPNDHAICEGSETAIREAVNLVRANGARALWLSTWQALPAAQEELTQRARRLATQINVEMVDAGAAMQRVPPKARGKLLTRDGHPDVAGTWLVAASLVRAASDASLAETTPPRSCGKDWRRAITAERPASRQTGAPARCHAVDAAQWHAIRAAVQNRAATPH